MEKINLRFKVSCGDDLRNEIVTILQRLNWCVLLGYAGETISSPIIPSTGCGITKDLSSNVPLSEYISSRDKA
ncbi:hypothetical protein LguiA_022393 [Lonicera macranthoides]